MAVAHIEADRRWFRAAAALMADHPAAVRELERAADRRGLTASLTAPEVRALADALPNDEVVAAALGRLEVAEESDRERRAYLHTLTDRWRSEARWTR